MYIKLTSKEVAGLSFAIIYLELDARGFSIREIAFDEENNLVHKFPSKHFKNGVYGIFDLVPFDIKEMESDLSEDEFEKLWNKSSL